MSSGIEASLNATKKIMDEARSIIDAEAPVDSGRPSTEGLKIAGKESSSLSNRVAYAADEDPQHCYYVIKMMVENSSDLELKRGRYGGIFKKNG